MYGDGVKPHTEGEKYPQDIPTCAEKLRLNEDDTISCPPSPLQIIAREGGELW